ncbi:MAG TPA: hypothetical protein VH595_01595 [Verrucomicrobiae bacterium]|nr:hypothetical protein [Verrucomicrobiae bacterium]
MTRVRLFLLETLTNGSQSRLFFIGVGIAVALLVFPRVCHADGTNDAVVEVELAKELENIPELSLAIWDKSVVVRSAFGYKDNVLFSPATQHPEGSGFTLNGLDVTVFRLMNNGSRFFFFVSGDDTRYFTPVKSESFSTLQPTTIDNEDDAIAMAQYRWNWTSNWESALALQYFYQNQVFNVATEAGALSTEAAVPADGNNITFRPSVRGQFGSNFWGEAELRLNRQFFDAPLYSYWLAGARLTLGVDVGRADTVSLSCEGDRLIYDSEADASRTGTNIAGTELRTWEHQAQLQLTHYFDRKKHWSSHSAASFIYNADNGSGFFNYYNYSFDEDLGWAVGKWNFKVDAHYWRFSFPWQTANVPGAPKLERDVVTCGARIERKLSKHWRVFMDYEHDSSLCNDPADRYEANIADGGAELEF